MEALNSSVSYVLQCMVRGFPYNSAVFQSYIMGSMDAIYTIGLWSEIDDISEDVLDEIVDMSIEYDRRHCGEKTKKNRRTI